MEPFGVPVAEVAHTLDRVTIWLNPRPHPEPRRFMTTPPLLEGPHIEVEWTDAEAAARGDDPTRIELCDATGISAPHMKRLTWDHWLRFAELEVRLAGGFNVADAQRLYTTRTLAVGGPLVGIPDPPKRPGRNGHEPELYQRIADRYRQLVADGNAKPTLTIAAELGIERPTVAGWIRKCRALGLLPPAHHGKPG